MSSHAKTAQYTVNQRRLVATLFDWVGTMVTALVVLVLLFTFVFRNVGVEGDSMQPTLQTGDRLLLSSLANEYERGDIVVIDRYTDEPLIKRVVAVAGDTVEILADNTLLINGIAQYEPYIQGYTVSRDMAGIVTVPEGRLFVMGDNRTNSKDSRMNEIGMVSVKDVVGKAIFRLWPLSSFGGIYTNMEHNLG